MIFLYFLIDNKADEVQSIQPPSTGTLPPSSSLSVEDESLPSLFFESGSGVQSNFCSPAVNTRVVASDSNKNRSPEGGLKHVNKPDSTVLLSQTMEMTVSHPTEIVTVENKVRKTGNHSNAEAKENKQTCGSDKADNQVKNRTHSTKNLVKKTDAEEPTLKDRPEDKLHLPKNKSLNVPNSHMSIKDKKKSKIKLKSQQTEQDPGVCNVSLNLGDAFTDPAANFSDICISRTSLLREDGAEEVTSNITCRRSKNNEKRASASRKTFVTRPFLVGEPDSHFKVVEKDRATEPGRLVNDHQFRRQTFIISDHSPPKRASQAAGLTEQGARSVRAAPDQLVSQTTSFSSQSDACPTQRPQSRCGGSSQASQDFAVPSVHANPKKTSRKEKKPLDKKETAQKRQRTCEKEKEGSCLGNRKLRCSDKAQFMADNVHDTNTESDVVGPSLSDRSEEAGSSEQFYGLDLDMLKLHGPSEPRNPRGTFVVRQLDDSVDGRQSGSCDVNSHVMSTRHEPENLLMDERPPWLNTDVSLADTEAASSFSTPRRKTRDGALLNLESATEATRGG